MRLSLIQYETMNDEIDTDRTDITVTKIETELNWFSRKERWWARIGTIHGLNLIPLIYVIRPDKPDGWDLNQAMNDQE